MTRLLSFSLAVSLAAGCAHLPSPKEVEAAQIQYDLGANLLGQGREQEAMKSFQEALKLDPNFPEPLNGLGLIYHYSYQRLGEAEKYFRRALDLRPGFSDAWNNLGALLAQKGELVAAREAFDTALSDTMYLTPHIAQTNLAWVVHLQGDTKAAESLVRAALGTSPRYCAGHRQLARLFEAQDRQRDADASWEAFATYCPNEPEALLHLAEVQARAGDETQAARTLMKCLEKAGSKAVSSDCRALLATLPPLPLEAEEVVTPPGPDAAGQSVDGARDLESRR